MTQQLTLTSQTGIKYPEQVDVTICSYPLCVTSVCRSPSLRNMSTTVSIGVWSVMVMGAMSNIFFSLSGGGPVVWGGAELTNRTSDWPQIPSSVRFAFAAVHSQAHQT
jgi:hypothetical protein